MRNNRVFAGITAISLILLCFHAYSQLTPQEAAIQMSRGINIGNTLEPPDEGSWNNPPVEEYYFDDYKAAGFSTVRIPISWYNHTETLAPYTVDGDWMDRVEQIVDWGLARKLIIIINAHHESWLKENPSPENLERFDSIWSQIAVRFQGKSDSLFFEMINEPYPMAQEIVDALNARVLSIIRKTNPTRIVLFSGYMWSNSAELLQAAIPDDDYLMGYFHSYDPWSFAGEGNGIWGSSSDVNAIKTQFDQVQQWTNNTGIPVLIGEFGAIFTCDFNSRSYHYATYVEQSLSHNIPFTVWDDGGQFRMYDRENHGWNYLKDIVTNFSEWNPTQLRATNLDGDSVKLTWVNRTTENDSIFVKRGSSPLNMATIARLNYNLSEYTDTAVEESKTYFYRVIAHFEDTTDLFTYPVTVTATRPSFSIERNASETLCLYPNPAGDQVHIILNTNEPILYIAIYTMSGQLIEKVNPANNILPVNHLKAGCYIVKVQAQTKSYMSILLRE